MKNDEWVLVRDVFVPAKGEQEGYTLGRLFFEEGGEQVCFTVEDEDRRVEEGNPKIYGKTAMPLGRFELKIYPSPRHGIVPLFLGVPGFTYTEFHKANRAEELLGCVAVGEDRTVTGVSSCAPALKLLIARMRSVKERGGSVFCTIRR